MFRMLVAMGPWSTISSTGSARTPKFWTISLPGSTDPLFVARLAPRTPSQTTGMNWPRALAA